MSEGLHFVLLGLFAFRAQRLVTNDEWPPSDWFRNRIAQRTGADSGWTTLFNCAWCFGLWTAIAVVLVDHFYGIPTVVLLIGAVGAVVGLLSDLVNE